MLPTEARTRLSAPPRHGVLAALLLVGIGGLSETAHAQCTVSGSSVTLGAGSCAIAPNATLNGTPAVHATTGAQISTNNVTINPFNGGSIGALAETLGTITFNWSSLERFHL